MKNHATASELTNVLRATTAIQVAVFELAGDDVEDNIAFPALEACVSKLVLAVKALKGHVR